MMPHLFMRLRRRLFVPLRDRRMVRWLLLLILTGVGLQTAWSQEPVSIHQFVGIKEQWPKFADGQTRFRLEGRLALVSTKLVKFRNCDLSFVGSDDVEFPRIRPGTTNMVVSGYMTRDKGRVQFLVTSFQRDPTDDAKVRQKRSELDEQDAEPWYELGAWVRERAVFYEDSELANEGAAIQERGIGIERRGKRADASALRNLAEKVVRMKLSSGLRMALIHEALWLDRQSSRNPAAILAQIRQDLEGSQLPLEPGDQQFIDGYLKEPILAYSNADSTERRRMHRVFFADLQRDVLLSRLNEDGSNAFTLARQIEDELPEFRAEAERLRDAELARRRTVVDSLSRPAMLELAELFRDRDQKDEARDVVLKWIQAREPEWRQQGVAGLVRLSEEYLELLSDRGTARLLLREAYERSARDPEIATRLRELGEAVARPEREAVDLENRDVANRDIVPGMSSGDVVRVLGEPDAVTRLASAGRLTEIWVYGAPTTTRISVRLETRIRDSGATTRVAQVDRLPAR